MRWICWWRWHHGGKWCQRSISAHFNSLARRTDGWYLLGGEGAKCFVYEVRMRRHHILPADGLHHVCCVTAEKLKMRKLTKLTSSIRAFDGNSRNLRVDEVDRLRFQLVGAVKICKYQRLGCCFHRKIHTQRFFTHHFELLKSVLSKGEERH